MKQHPYYPVDLQLPNYVPNDRSILELLGVFFGFTGCSLVVLWLIISGLPHMKNKMLLKLKVCWFFVCGLIHLVLEGYFGLFNRTIPEGKSFLAELWKEYGKGDSRYVSSDSFTVCMENVTAFVDGPLALLAVYAFVKQTSYRYVAQLVLSVCQLYGDVLYFTIEMFDGFTHGPVWHPLYFWFYFIFLNSLWIFIPFACIIESWKKIVVSQATSDCTDSDRRKKRILKDS